MPNLLNYMKTHYWLSMATQIESHEKYAWWINELNSLGVNTDNKNQELKDVQGLENLYLAGNVRFVQKY
jgi:anaerobic glycerol-3-phosphate dehydrogenase